jgi:hypothetical protein
MFMFMWVCGYVGCFIKVGDFGYLFGVGGVGGSSSV